MTDLAVRAVMTGDASGLVGAAKSGQAAVAQLHKGTNDLATASKVATAASAAHAGGLDLESIKTRALRGEMELLSLATGGASTQAFLAARAGLEIIKSYGGAGIAIGALTAGFDALIFRTFAYQASVRDLNIELAAHGNYLELTGAGVEALVDKVEKAGNFSNVGARSFIAALLPSRADADQITEFAKAADVLGLKMEDIAKMAEHPAEAIKQLNEQNRVLNDYEASLLPQSMNGVLTVLGKQEAQMKQNEDRTRGWIGVLKDWVKLDAAIQAAMDTGRPLSEFMSPGTTAGAGHMGGPWPAHDAGASYMANQQMMGVYQHASAEDTWEKAKKAAAAYKSGLQEIIDKVRGLESAEEKERQQQEAADHARQNNDIVQFYQQTARAAQQSIDNINSAYDQLPKSYEQAAAAAIKWRDDTIKAAVDAGTATVEMRSKVNQVLEHDLKQAYEDDLNHRTDWAAGVARANHDLAKNNADMASVSERAIKDFDREGEDAFAKLMSTGKLDIKNLADFVIEELARIAYRKALAPAFDSFLSSAAGAIGSYLGFGGIGSTPGTFGSDFGDIGASIGFAHSGALIGADTLATRYVHPAVFDHAPRFHSGGKPGGLSSGERAIVVQDGEGVFTPKQMDNADALLNAAMGSASQKPQVNLYITPPQGMAATVQKQQGPGGTTDIRVAFRAIDGMMADGIAKGTSITGQVLQQRFGLSRKL